MDSPFCWPDFPTFFCILIYMPIKRLPYIFGFDYVITGYRYSYLNLYHENPSLSGSGQDEQLLTIDIAYFIHMHCVCALRGLLSDKDTQERKRIMSIGRKVRAYHKTQSKE
jgi:hypothetical protein